MSAVLVLNALLMYDVIALELLGLVETLVAYPGKALGIQAEDHALHLCVIF